MCNEIDKIKHNIKPAFHNLIHLWRNIIRACHRHLATVAGLTNPLNDTFDIINLLCSSIINYKIVYKPVIISIYVQSDYNKEDNKRFFTNRKYQWDGPMCVRYRDANSLSSRLSYQLRTFKCIKKCFVCRKILLVH